MTHRPASLEAYADLKPGSARWRIVNALGIFVDGLTCAQLEEVLKMSHQTASARLCELEAEGRIVKLEAMRGGGHVNVLACHFTPETMTKAKRLRLGPNDKVLAKYILTLKESPFLSGVLETMYRMCHSPDLRRDFKRVYECVRVREGG